MLDRKDFRQPLYYQNGNALTGSDGLLRFRLAPATVTEGEGEDATDRRVLRAIAWPGPYCMEATADDKKQTADFSLDEEGIMAAIAWLSARNFA